MDELDLWLKENNLWPFRDLFVDNGYDELEVIAAITPADLKELGVTLPGHVKKILLKTARLAKKLKLEGTDAGEQLTEAKPGMPLYFVLLDICMLDLRALLHMFGKS